MKISIKQGGTSPPLVLQVGVDLTTAVTVHLSYTPSYGGVPRDTAVPVVRSMTVDAPAKFGQVRYKWQKEDTVVAGDMLAEVHVEFSNGDILIWPAEGYVHLSIEPDVADTTLDDDGVIKQLGAVWVMDPALFTLDGTKITAAKDAGGGTVVLASASGKEYHTDTTGPFGCTSLRTDNPVGDLSTATGGLGPTGTQPFHMCFVGRTENGAVSNSGFDGIMGMGAPAANPENVNIGVDVNGTMTAFTDTGGGGILKTYKRVGAVQLDATKGKDYIIELTSDGNTAHLFVDGQLNSTLDVSHAMNVPDGSFGFRPWYTGAGYPNNNCRIDAAMFASKVVPRSQMRKWLRYEMLQRLRANGGFPMIVKFVGESFVSGGATGTTPQKYIPAAVKDKAVTPYVIYAQNLGLSGGYVSNILAQKVDPDDDPGTHAVIWWGVNSINAHVPVAKLLADTSLAIRRYEDRGMKTLVCTMPPWLALSSDSIGMGILTDFNTAIMANPFRAAGVRDVAAKFGPYNAANFCIDHLHPTDTANDTLVAPEMYAGLVAIA